MSFQSPLLLLTLLVLPAAVALYLLSERRRMRYAIAYPNVDVLARVAGGRAWRRYVPPLLFLGALAVLCVSLARPHVERLVPNERATVVLVIDVSRSMQARDVRPTRLGAAQRAVRTFLERVPDKLRVALIVFSGEPYLATPPTADRELVRQAVDDIDFFHGFGGTAIGDALAAAVEVGQEAVGLGTPASRQLIAYRVAAAPSGPRPPVSILFLSDGAQTRGSLLPLEGAERAKAAGIPVYTVSLGTRHGTLPAFGFGGGGGGGGGGFGGPPSFGGGGGGGFTPSGRRRVPPDPATLRAIADQTGGRFFEARDAKSLDEAYAELGSRLGRVRGETEVTFAFLAGAAALLVAAGVLSALWSPRLP